jgi:pimeloyl-ACP methyl ester carboxylesterase
MNKPQIHPFLTVTILMALILSACAPLLQAPTATPITGVRFERADCMFGDIKGVDCGYLYVPEDRSQSGGPQLQLAVAIIRSSNPNPAPDPVLILFSWLGGPGAHILVTIDGLMSNIKEILVNRDVIVFDQRGTGYSLPNLDCEEVQNQVVQDASQNISQKELQRHSFQAYQDCYDRLAQQGIDLSAYTSAADAADVNDLRLALGYKEWNIYGDSYGARRALTIMRDFPEGVRSVVLDSVYPPQANSDIEATANADRALKLLFERCAADKACNAAYPNLESVFYDAATQLDTDPILLKVIDPETQKEYPVLINGDQMINLIIRLLHSSYALPFIPGWIYKFYDGNAAGDEMLKSIIYIFAFFNGFSSEGKGLSVQCSETINQPAETADAEINPRLQEAVNVGRYLSLCPAWNVEPATGAEIEPVVSDIPTLLVTGDSDPTFSPAWQKSTAENLSHSYSFEFPWAPFGLIYGSGPATECARSIVSAFINDPATKPSATCMDNLNINFVTGQ